MKLELLLKYVDVLLSCLKSHEDIERARKELKSFLELYQTSAELTDFLQSPFYKTLDKERVLRELGVKMGFLPQISATLAILLRNGRLGHLHRMVLLFEQYALRTLGKESVTVFYLHELSKTDKKTLESKIEQEIKRVPEVEYVLDTDLIGGYVVRIGDRVFDYSVKGRLEALEDIVFKMRIR